MKLIYKKGVTSFITHVFIQDSSSTTGAGLAGLTFETASLVAYYVKPGGTLTALTLETIGTLGTYAAPTSAAHMRFKLVHDTNAPGLYEIQLHNDVLASGNAITIMMHGAANMAPLPLEIQLTDLDLNAASTPQTGDSYGIVNHADYGNAKLVRSTTPANALDVSATGEAGLDFNNIKDATGAHTLTNITVPLVTTCTTNTDMRGTDGANTTVPDAAGTAATLHGITDGKIDVIGTNVDQIETAVITNAAGVDIAADIIAMKIDTKNLYDNQGNWSTATGFATPTNITAGTITTVSGNVNGSVATCAAATLAADQAVNVTKIAGVAVNTGTAQLGVNVVTEANVDFGALKKASLNASTPASVTTVTGNVNGSVATCAAATVSAIGDNVITAASIASDAVTEIITAIKAMTGITAGGTTTFASAMKIILAKAAGDVTDGDSSDYNYGDIDDGTEVFSQALSETTPYRDVTVA